MSKGNPPTIGIDCRFASSRSGIGRYVRELTKRLITRNDPWKYVLLQSSAPHYSIKEQIMMPKDIKRAGIDLLHVPHFNVPLFMPACPDERGARRRVPFVTTIHDLILHTYPNEASPGKRFAYKTLMKHAVKKAEHIIAVSEHTAGHLAHEYGEKMRDKTSVIYEGVSEEFSPVSQDDVQHIKERYNLFEDFILYVGACKEHKNVQTLIDATPDDLILVIVSGGKEVKKLHKRPNTRVLRNVNDDDLPGLYTAARAFVTASHAEGFGLPILEAMACGCPVIASNKTSIPEVAGEYATLIAPTVNELRVAIEHHRHQQHGGDMMKHARSFSWEKMTDETVKVYQTILNKD